MTKRITRMTVLLVLAVMLCTVLASCITIRETRPSVVGLATIHEEEFGGVYLEMTIEDFNEKGFSYGDSVDVIFSNGYKLEDIPYYNGYYVAAGDPLLIAYPGYDYIKAAINYGEDLWDEARLYGIHHEIPVHETLWSIGGLNDHVTATVSLRERGKYADIQAARDIQYSDIREGYPSDEAFANFRPMNVGGLKENWIYRSASPCNNQHNRAPYVDRLMAEAGVQCILNLADDLAKIEGYVSRDDFASPCFLSLLEDQKVIALAMNMNFSSQDFRDKIAKGLTAMSEMEGPYLVHCTEGKDRTGFMCMLLEALTGASYREIVDDYMLTYDNYYKINETKDKAKYDVILNMNLIAMMKEVAGDPDADLETADLSSYARAYLLDCGMEEDAIDALISRLTQ